MKLLSWWMNDLHIVPFSLGSFADSFLGETPWALNSTEPQSLSMVRKFISPATSSKRTWSGGSWSFTHAKTQTTNYHDSYILSWFIHGLSLLFSWRTSIQHWFFKSLMWWPKFFSISDDWLEVLVPQRPTSPDQSPQKTTGSCLHMDTHKAFRREG